MPKIRKCQWIAKPRKLRISSSTDLCFECSGEHHLVWTTDEDERISFNWQGDAECGIAIIFSLDQGLSIHKEADGHTVLEMDFLGIRTTSSWDCGADKVLTVEKKGDTVSFISDGRTLHSMSFPSIAASVSISFHARGQGDVAFHFHNEAP